MTSSNKNTILSYFKVRTKETVENTENSNVTKRECRRNLLSRSRASCKEPGETSNDGTLQSAASAVQSDMEIDSSERQNSLIQTDLHHESKLTKESESCSSSFNRSVETSAGDDSSPYYLNNFIFIVKTVVGDDHFQALFNDVDKEFVHKFHSLTDNSKKLYVRLFQRNHKWLRHTKIKYPQVAENLAPCWNELIENDFIYSAADLQDLNDALQMLFVNEAKNLAKEFKLKENSKKEIITSLMTHVSRHKPLFGGNQSQSLFDRIMKCVKEILGPCYKLKMEARSCFIRIFLLFNLPVIADYEDDPTGGQSKQLYLLLRVNQGLLTFPDYEVFRISRIFGDRDSLLRYEVAKTLEYRLIDAILDKNLDEACSVYSTIRENYNQLAVNFKGHRDESLPIFLKRFTAEHVYVRCLSSAVDVFQKKKDYDHANEILRTLLEQKSYCQDYRGRWWDRLALNLDQHLKKKIEALSEIHKALEEGITGEHYISLVTRGHSLCKSNSKKGIYVLSKTMPLVNLKEARKVEILGKLLNHNTSRMKSAFVSQDSTVSNSGDVFILGVEQLALQHYREKGFTEGIHGETSTILSLYGLLFWDIIYKSGIPDVFQSPFQAYPLDIRFDHFYNSRAEDITRFLAELQNMEEEELINKVMKSWETNKDKASLINWDMFTGIHQVQGLVKSIGGKKLAGLCHKLSTDFRHYKSGAPDLLVWDPDNRVFKFVEVKGPSDRLSIKQRLWIDYMISLEIDVEVCHVSATGAKRLKKDFVNE